MARAFVGLLPAVLALSQLGATCAYSPPPVLAHGQGADTLGTARGRVAAEAGWGRAASWWNSYSAADFDVHSGLAGVGRLRVGVGQDLDVGLVSGAGPEGTYVLGPEAKWRFARLAMPSEKGSPGLHAALVSGFAAGSALYRYDHECSGNDCVPGNCSGDGCLYMVETGQPRPRYGFVAPYTGVIASGGIDVVQMYVGLRLAASETLGNRIADLTLYPVLAYGVNLQPDPLLGFYAEGDVAGGLTTQDLSDSALIGYATAGVSLTFDELWAH
jgi:hypothetical protein